MLRVFHLAYAYRSTMPLVRKMKTLMHKKSIAPIVAVVVLLMVVSESGPIHYPPSAPSAPLDLTCKLTQCTVE